MDGPATNETLASIQSLPSNGGQSALPLVVDEAEDTYGETTEPASKTSVIAANLKPRTSNINQVYLPKRNQLALRRN